MLAGLGTGVSIGEGGEVWCFGEISSGFYEVELIESSV